MWKIFAVIYTLCPKIRDFLLFLFWFKHIYPSASKSKLVIKSKNSLISLQNKSQKLLLGKDFNNFILNSGVAELLDPKGTTYIVCRYGFVDENNPMDFLELEVKSRNLS